MEKIIDMTQEELTNLNLNQPNKVIDCFIFNGELDMLEFRLMELDDVVDIFIIVESKITFSGLPKDLHFHLNKKRFAKWLHKIHYHVVDNMPTGSSNEDNWLREEYQRDAIKFALDQLSPNPTDRIIISDLDEIPNSYVINHFKHNIIWNEGAIGLCMDWYYYNLNTRLNVPPSTKPKILYYQKMLTMGLSPNQIRLANWHSVLNGGWHLTFFMSVEEIISKLGAYSHQEYNTSEITNPEKLLKRIKEGKDIFPGREESNSFFQLPIKDNPHLPKNYKFWLKNSRTL